MDSRQWLRFFLTNSTWRPLSFVLYNQVAKFQMESCAFSFLELINAQIKMKKLISTLKLLDVTFISQLLTLGTQVTSYCSDWIKQLKQIDESTKLQIRDITMIICTVDFCHNLRLLLATLWWRKLFISVIRFLVFCYKTNFLL